MAAARASHSCVLNKPTRIEFHKLKILILDAPNNSNVGLYLREMVAYGVVCLVRTCEANYDLNPIIAEGIVVRDLVFQDGDPPPGDIVTTWLELIRGVVANGGSIAVHCVAGLGRAPVLACIALVEYGMQPLDAIFFVRERRKGAINRKQLEYLKSYKKKQNKQCLRMCHLM